jgi:peptide/nickel transport system substrate-binding protein
MDVTQEPYTDPRVVKAVKLAADRARMLAVVAQGRGTVTQDVWIPAANPLYPPALKASITNIAQAKQLLKDAGHGSGIQLELTTATSTEFGPEFSAVLQQLVRPAGIDIKINQFPADTFWSDAWLKKPFVTSWWFQRFPADILALVFKKGASWNESKFDNPAFEKTLNQALAATDPKKEQALYRKALTITAQQSGELVPFFNTAYLVAKKNVFNVKPHLNRFVDFSEAWIA